MTAPRQLRASGVDQRVPRRRALPHSERSPALGREMVREVLGDRDRDFVATVEVLTSELVTNAIIHAQSMVIVHIQLSERSVRVVVEDTADEVPQPRAASEPEDITGWSEDGRGLVLVGALASSWGWDRTSTGKQVWFTVDAPA